MARAKRGARAGRTMALFFAVLAILFGLVATGSSWKPELGLDLQGGTQISMQAESTDGGSIPDESLEEARNIIDQRVNGSGVTSAKVTTEGNDVIQVSIPGQGSVQQELAERVRQTAKLRFRLVACSSQQPGPCATAGGNTGQVDPNQLGGGQPGQPSQPGTQPRAGLGFDDAAAAPSDSPSASDEASGNGSDNSTAQPADPQDSGATDDSSESSKGKSGGEDDVVSVDDATQFMRSPPPEWIQKFSTFQCPGPDDEPVEDDPSQPLVTCDDQGQITYLLSPAIIEGTQISDADFGIPQNSTSYAVFLDFQSEGNDAFADATGAIAGTGELFAITLDGQVISAATAESRISGGAQITGGFNQETAEALANNLKYGSLPLDFPEDNIQTRVIGPTLAGNQLTAGLWAGLIGLLLVALYCVLYYRGMSIVVIASLVVAGAATYLMIVLLSETAGVTLDLPGVAGLIVGVGITADSFIVYFERIRDEMRDGKTMRVAVEAAWARAKRTCLAADAVSFLAALVLYIFATNEVRGFAFMLGLTTLIDVAVFFWFTHPMVKMISGLRFFNRQHRFSGLSKASLGMGKAQPAGGRA